MRRPPSLLLAALVLATPAAAQTRLAGGEARPAAAAPAAAAPAARPAIVYRLATWRDGRLPAEVIVASAPEGLAASYRGRADRVERPMTLAVIGNDLVLQGETPSGVLTLRLHDQNDPRPGVPVTGRWWLGADEGVLRGSPLR